MRLRPSTLLAKAIFIDKDGTLIEDVPYNVDPLKIKLMNGAAQSLLALRRQGFEIYVISNQPGVETGRFQYSALKEVEQELTRLLGKDVLSGFYWCPHAPESRCGCRKPEPGMLFRAAHERKIDLSASWMIGDILNDVEAGHRAGCRSILVENGNETEWKLSPLRFPEFMAPDLEAAVAEIIRCDATPIASIPAGQSVRRYA